MNPNSPKWQQRFLGVAQEVANWSKDTTKVGCVLVAPDGAIISTGYNGLPPGVADTDARLERPEKYDWIVHGEAAAIANAARHGAKTNNATAYCTHAPCSGCTRLLINAGIAEVRYGSGTTSMPEDEFTRSATMFREAGIVCRPVCTEENS
ncbi:deoxycytidylate deaminase [EBPR siphovirus 2]|nr:deoxycytidylate deaminase [EBPR siphovirus 2]